MKIKSLNTRKREILIVSASITILVILILVLFLFSRHIALKVEEIYTNPTIDSGPIQDAKLDEYKEIIDSVFPNGIPAEFQSEASTSTLTAE